MAHHMTKTDWQSLAGVRREPTWVFRCPVDSCRMYESGFCDQQDAENALLEHLDESHD